jgi:branched-chain amino acid transport system substrate-binding protein
MIDFLVEHADGNASLHLEKVKMFHEMGVDLIIGGYWSSQALTSKDYVTENGMLLLSPSSTAPSLAIPGDNLYRLPPSDEAQGKALARMMESKGVENAIVFYRDEFWAQEVTNVFMVEFEAMGGSVIGHYPYPVGETDFTSYLDDASNAAEGVDDLGVLLISLNEAAEILIQTQSYPNLYNPPWFGFEFLGRSFYILDNAPEEAVYLKLYSPAPAIPDTPKYHDFAERYRSLTGEDASFYNANEFDAAWLITQAILETRPTSMSLYDATDVINIFPDVASRYYGYSGYCLLNEAGDRVPGSYEIWGYYLDDGEPSYKIYGRYNAYTDEIQWYN